MKVLGGTTKYRNHISKACQQCGRVEKAIKLTEMQIKGEWVKVCNECFMRGLH